MKIGTRSLLFGCHQFLLHPAFVLYAWVKLYGKPNWKEFVCIVIHDWGYGGSPNMDGPEGESHPEWAANWTNRHLDNWDNPNYCYYLCLFHSRFFAKKLGGWPPSNLCWADKLGTASMPTWLWVCLAKLSGEVKEYLADQRYEIHGHTCPHKFFEAYKNLVRTKMLPR